MFVLRPICWVSGVESSDQSRSMIWLVNDANYSLPRRGGGNVSAAVHVFPPFGHQINDNIRRLVLVSQQRGGFAF